MLGRGMLVNLRIRQVFGEITQSDDKALLKTRVQIITLSLNATYSQQFQDVAIITIPILQMRNRGLEG